MPTQHSPTARHRRLASELRKLRESAGLSPEDAALALGFSRTKLVRIETAARMPSVEDVNLILGTYGSAEQPMRLALIELARRIRERGWWAVYGDVLDGSYAELEDAASLIRSWQVQTLPGLLQTESYARALFARDYPNSPAEVDRRIEARTARKGRLQRPTAPQLEVVLAEEALRRQVGGKQVMSEQLETLLHVGAQPNVSIRVVPIDVGEYPMMGHGSLVIFDFPEANDLGVAYVETVTGGIYVENVEQVRRCNLTFDRITEAALPEEQSTALIASFIKESSPCSTPSTPRP